MFVAETTSSDLNDVAVAQDDCPSGCPALIKQRAVRRSVFETDEHLARVDLQGVEAAMLAGGGWVRDGVVAFDRSPDEEGAVEVDREGLLPITSAPRDQACAFVRRSGGGVSSLPSCSPKWWSEVGSWRRRGRRRSLAQSRVDQHALSTQRSHAY